MPESKERVDFSSDEPKRRSSPLLGRSSNIQVSPPTAGEFYGEHPSKYSWNAEDYAKHSSTQYELAKELIPKLRLSGNEALLDIGCGDSKVTAQLASSLPGGCVVGIDNSEGMVDLARRNFPQTAYPNLHFQRMNVQSLDFQDQFDRVFSNAALHWVIDQRPVLKGVQRSLKAGGSLLFQMGQRQRSRNTRSHRRAYA